MMSHPLRMEDAEAKFLRAQEHLKALGAAITAYESQQPSRPERSDDLPEGKVRIRLGTPPPRTISVILGDVVHNLRSALDYATCALVEFCDPEFDIVKKKTQFPFGKINQKLNSDERRGLGKIYPWALLAIEEARRCGDAYLHLLNKLSNQDKHRLLVRAEIRQYPVRIEVDTATQTAAFVPDLDGQPDVWFRPLQDGDVIDMPNPLHFKLGIVIEGTSHPYAAPAIDQMNRATATALAVIAQALDPVEQHPKVPE